MKLYSRIEQLEARQLMSVSLSAIHDPIITPAIALSGRTVISITTNDVVATNDVDTSSFIPGPMTASSVKPAASLLSVGFDSSGLASITYNGAKLLDGKANPGDRFAVTDVTLIKSDGTRVTTGWPVAKSTNWNASTNTLTMTFDWGTVSCQYTSASDRVTMKLSVTNTSTMTIAGLNVMPMALRFPKAPSNLTGSTLAVADQGPAVVSADFGTGTVALVGEDVARDEYIAMQGSGSLTTTANRWLMRVGSTGQTNQPSSWPTFDRPVAPGATDSYTSSLRFGATKTANATIASDMYSKFAAANPLKLTWTDKRAIAMLNPASEGHRTATNPNGWIVGSNIDVTTPAGLANFRTQMLAYADQSIAIMKDMNAQGMITWDIEGEGYPGADYIGDPRLATTLAPEMGYQNTINDYFKKFTDAGFKVGVTIRADKVVFNGRTPTQVSVSDSDLAQLLIDKISYAKNNWGATLFYIDSTDANTSAGVYQQVMSAIPGILLIPENKNSGDYSVSAPYNTPRLNVYSTPGDVKSLYANAFSVINAIDATNTATSQTALNAAVKQGDILLFQGWWNNPLNAMVKAAYKANTTTPAAKSLVVSPSFSSMAVSVDGLDSNSANDWLKSAA